MQIVVSVPKPSSSPTGVDAATQAARRTPNFRSRISRMDMFINAALEVFHELGYDHGRLDDIAKRAGVSKTAVYNHFPSKYALLVATVERACLPMLPDPPHQPGHGLERALAMGPAARVLDIVLAERRSLPQIGPLYYEATLRRLLQWPNVSGREAAEAMLQPALKAASFERLFRAPAIGGATA